ncbi:GNAT family N-acetyltransferase [Streptomyces sp. NPDC051578]|uniref:GNAT family N-acetyltransferase n=1 Tax=Streptomyces sp. NPDC051578 TaxID=3365662 RepID=UPI0037A26C3B
MYEVLPAGVAAQVEALEAAAWPGARPGHDPALTPRTVVLWDGRGHATEAGAAAAAGQRAGRRAQDTAGQRAGEAAGLRAGAAAGQRARAGAGQRAGEAAGLRAGAGAGQRAGVVAGQRAGEAAGQRARAGAGQRARAGGGQRARAGGGAGPVADEAAKQPAGVVAGQRAGVVGACLTLLRKEIRLAGATYRAAGLSAVVTRPELRGRGLGGRLVTAARELLAADPEVDVALFSCDRELTPFYEAAGFERLPGTVLLGGTRADPLPSDRPGFDKSVLAAFFTPDPAATRAVFTAARIPLYPGPVDRLW